MLDEPEQMTADQRLDEIATVLAEGVLLLRRRLHIAPVSLEQIPSNSGQNSLEVSGDMPLHGADGLPTSGTVISYSTPIRRERLRELL